MYSTLCVFHVCQSAYSRESEFVRHIWYQISKVSCNTLKQTVTVTSGTEKEIDISCIPCISYIPYISCFVRHPNCIFHVFSNAFFTESEFVCQIRQKQSALDSCFMYSMYFLFSMYFIMRISQWLSSCISTRANSSASAADYKGIHI